MSPLGLIGGTGPQGYGLALRCAAAGHPVLIGSRAAPRAKAAAERIRSAVHGATADGTENLEVLARTDRVVLAVPFVALASFLEATAGALAGKLVVDVVVPVTLRDDFFTLVPVDGAASAGELIQRSVPTARVVSAFKNLPAERLLDLSSPLEGDVLVCGDDPAARLEVHALVALIPGLRAVDAGRLANARSLEAITALLLNLNRLHGARTSIAITGLR